MRVLNDRRVSNLTLVLQGEYFDEIVAGTKREEYRLCTPYWTTRLDGRTYETLTLTRGYPPASDTANRLVLPWCGCTRTRIQHPHFGPRPVDVFAVRIGAVRRKSSRR